MDNKLGRLIGHGARQRLAGYRNWVACLPNAANRRIRYGVLLGMPNRRGWGDSNESSLHAAVALAPSMITCAAFAGNLRLRVYLVMGISTVLQVQRLPRDAGIRAPRLAIGHINLWREYST